MKGKIRRGLRTKELVKYLQPNEIAVIAHEDIDDLAAQSLVDTKIQGVINTAASISGKYPHRGPEKLLDARIPVLDQVGNSFFDQVKDGLEIEIKGEKIFAGDNYLGQGQLLSRKIIYEKFHQGEKHFNHQLKKFIHNTIEYASKEQDLIGQDLNLPELEIDFHNRHTLIVVRGKNYLEDLNVIKPYINEMKPILIGVDGGADALRSIGYRPDLIIGDMDSISDETLKCGAKLLVHAYGDGRAPGMNRVEALGLDAKVIPAMGTSEDVAMLLAYQLGTELIVAVGSHSNVIDFLEKGRPGMASTFLVRLKVGSILVDAKGVSKLYRQKLKPRYIVQIVIAALLPFLIVSSISPQVSQFLRLLSMKLRILFQI
ncbi:MAG: putative cytokinetic ring protein SteA [Dehalobacterium sp.]|jgi:uncharacterized membrane-anchored protein